jgi:DNA-directed RNA polymerase specialized sigma subunit
MRQGVRVTSEKESRVVHLLKTTDMNLELIASRIGISGAKVTGINRKHNVRIYSNRSNYTLSK